MTETVGVMEVKCVGEIVGVTRAYQCLPVPTVASAYRGRGECLPAGGRRLVLCPLN